VTAPALEPVTWNGGGAEGPGAQEIVKRFHDLYCHETGRTWHNTSWLGVPSFKCPLDLWIYQELIFSLRPGAIVETGTARGGTAYFLASICDLIGGGRVVTVDAVLKTRRPDHPRITYLTGSSIEPATVAAVTEAVHGETPVLVTLDSAHTHEHVLAEMRAYAPLVSEGSYLIVEDTNINSWSEGYGPGPLEAVRDFLAEDDRFEVDRSKEKFFLTFNPGGYLRRVRG
jgi:cephalosporin hydroxylase